MTQPLNDSDDFPTLTDVVGEPTGSHPIPNTEIGDATGQYSLHTQVIDHSESADTPAALPINDPTAFLIQLHQDLETHIENVFAKKLQRHLADAQQRAVEAALAELKDELPQLVVDAFEATKTSQTPT
ncbi:MAG: hypothetical protein PHP57_12945 [Sideroxydans sp.]|nr:hypothetical protein [Sideroxydans sp.]